MKLLLRVASPCSYGEPRAAQVDFWPPKLVVAKAYVDQLECSQALPPDRIAALRTAMQNAEASHMNKGKVAKLKALSPSLEKDPSAAKSPADASRLHALAELLKHPSA